LAADVAFAKTAGASGSILSRPAAGAALPAGFVVAGLSETTASAAVNEERFVGFATSGS
jgi:hypothetical protein